MYFPRIIESVARWTGEDKFFEFFSQILASTPTTTTATAATATATAIDATLVSVDAFPSFTLAQAVAKAAATLTARVLGNEKSEQVR